jgi:hypothetical protein
MISQKTEKHAGILDTFAGLWHKKNPEKDQTIQQVLTADVPVKKEE